MQSSSDSSIWRSLAVAFGDGLAFGVGVKLSQTAARQAGAPPKPDSGVLSDRLNQVEQTIKRIERAPAAPGVGTPVGTDQKSSMDQKVLEAIVAALEARLKEHAGQVERRLADLDARIAIGMKSLDERDRSLAAQFAGDLKALEGQLVSLNREFGEAVAEIVASQVAAQVEARATELEGSLGARIASAVDASVEQRVSRAIGARLEPLERQLREETARKDREIAELRQGLAGIDIDLEQRLAPMVGAQLGQVERQLRQEIGQKDREIVELRQRLTTADTNLLDIVSGIGQVCRHAAERMARPAETTTVQSPPPAAVAESGPPVLRNDDPTAIESEVVPEPFGETPLPGFAQPQKPKRLWRVPLVSSLVVLTSGGLLLMHYL